MYILLTIPFILWLIGVVMFQAPKHTTYHLSLAYQYVQEGGMMGFWQNVLRESGSLLIVVALIYFRIKNKIYKEKPNFALLDGARCIALCCAAFQLNIMYWAAQLCRIRAACHNPAEYWAYSPLFLVISLALSIYFSYLLSKTTVH